jgi:hypothetical protein
MIILVCTEPVITSQPTKLYILQENIVKIIHKLHY